MSRAITPFSRRSPLYNDTNRTLNAQYDPDLANKLLDEIGLTERDAVGIRKLPDGRLLEIIVEVDGEAADIVDALQLITEMWRDVGVKLFVKPQDRTILRQRSYSGLTVMVAAGGLDNALPTPEMPPTEIAPVRQDNYSWPKWGQWVETQGKNGEEPDIEAARKLIALYKGWLRTGNIEESARIWSEMLAHPRGAAILNRHGSRRNPADRRQHADAQRAREGRLFLRPDGADGHLSHRRILVRVAQWR